MKRPITNQKHPKISKDTKRRPLKVVYISNPMKFEATADEFRAVVHKLTGQQSNIVDLAEAKARGFLTAGIGNGSTNMETNSVIDQACQPGCGSDISSSFDGYLCENFVNEYDMFGDLSSICHESLRY